MITERLGRHTVKLWETIDELPIDRFTAWNKYMMIDSSIGSTFEEIETKHLNQLVSIIDDKSKALQQIANLRELVFSVLNKVNYQHHAYCCMVHSIDGEEMTDYSDTGIKEMLKRLDKIGVTNGNIKKKMNPLKKVFIQISKRFSQISSTGPGSTTIMKS
jgi:hypothetical protein